MDFPFFTEDEQPTMAKFNEKFQALLERDVKFAAGTYVGDGEGTKTLTFQFKPQIVIISKKTTSPVYYYLFVAERNSQIGAFLVARSGGNAVSSYLYHLVWGENNISITRDSENEFPYHNTSGDTYYYHSIG